MVMEKYLREIEVQFLSSLIYKAIEFSCWRELQIKVVCEGKRQWGWRKYSISSSAFAERQKSHKEANVGDVK